MKYCMYGILEWDIDSDVGTYKVDYFIHNKHFSTEKKGGGKVVILSFRIQKGAMINHHLATTNQPTPLTQQHFNTTRKGRRTNSVRITRKIQAARPPHT